MDKQTRIQNELLTRLDFEKYIKVSEWIISNIDKNLI